ncbi:MAG: UDP-N-acetylmuramoyl-L-alanine--D-glutamate ligase, partial [Synergistales bacterium]|nr:UDP-N-acetylmuramoyl-L-alanine--D-glutamate ligase [Synergistales bacterium]
PISCYAGMDLDYIVIELSSFQLYWTNLLKPDLAVITNLAPDHIDWHGTYSNYISAKSRICQLRKRESWAVIQERDIPLLQIENMEKVMPLRWSPDGQHQFTSEITMDMTSLHANMELEGNTRNLIAFDEVPLIGDHNLENVAMALASVELMGVRINDPASVMAKFIPPPHRCEFVGEMGGVTYVDDSKGTNVAASKTALSSIKGRKIVILGGRGKGEDYRPLAEEVKKSTQIAILLGEESDAIARSLEESGFSAYYKVSSMDEAVHLSAKLADPGMTVLLSPACTSWDMYSSYKKRGEHFQELVKELSGGVKDHSAE